MRDRCRRGRPPQDGLREPNGRLRRAGDRSGIILCPGCLTERLPHFFRDESGSARDVCRVCITKRLKAAQRDDKKAKRNAEKWHKEDPYWQRSCRRKNSSARRARQLRATPPWVENSAFNSIYYEAQKLTKQTGVEYHVDHIIPLKHDLVCGLHVPWNLQILTATENLKKKNSFELE